MYMYTSDNDDTYVKQKKITPICIYIYITRANRGEY